MFVQPPTTPTLLGTLNPLVTLLLIAIITTTMIISFVPSTAVLILIAELPLILLAKLTWRQWLFRGWPLAGALLGIMITNLIFTDIRTGPVLLGWGEFAVTVDGVIAAVWVAARILTLAIPGIVLFARLEPSELSDALITHWRVNPRMAVGSLAALRMAPLVYSDLRQSHAARRTRGVISRNPLVAIPTLFGTLSTVLVAAIRRATRLSVAMDSRGFDSGVERTLARRSVWRRRDSVVIMGYLSVCLVAVIFGRVV